MRMRLAVNMILVLALFLAVFLVFARGFGVVELSVGLILLVVAEVAVVLKSKRGSRSTTEV